MTHDDVSKLPAWPDVSVVDFQDTHQAAWYAEEERDAYRARMEALAEVVRMLPRSCDDVHHERADRHADDVPCPVVLRIHALLAACGRSSER